MSDEVMKDIQEDVKPVDLQEFARYAETWITRDGGQRFPVYFQLLKILSVQGQDQLCCQMRRLLLTQGGMWISHSLEILKTIQFLQWIWFPKFHNLCFCFLFSYFYKFWPLCLFLMMRRIFPSLSCWLLQLHSQWHPYLSDHNAQ